MTNKKLFNLHDEVTDTFLYLIKLMRESGIDEETGEPSLFFKKGHGSILKEAREWIKQNGVEKPKPADDDPLNILSEEVDDLPFGAPLGDEPRKLDS